MKKLNFTDGTFVLVWNEQETPIKDGSEHIYAFPNSLWLSVAPVTSVRKIDLDGNVWTFSRTSGSNFTINVKNTDGLNVTKSNNTKNTCRLVEDKNGRIHAQFTDGEPFEYIPFIVRDDSRFLKMNMYNTIGNTKYPDVGSAIAAGQTRTAGYCVSNVIPHEGSIFDGLDAFSLEKPGSTWVRDLYNMYSSNNSDDPGAIVTVNSLEEFNPVITPGEDPYNPGGTNDDDPDQVGGDGDFTDQDEATPLPDLPSLSAIDTGLVTVYNPSNGDLKNLANYLWSDLFSLDTFKKLFADPMDAILGLSIVPVQPPVSGSAEVTVGNIGTGISMPKVSNQYVRVDCGTLNVKEYWGAYLDYSPYTKAEIYLPYIGIRPMNIDDVMKKSIHVYYHVDVLSGGCVCYVYSGEKIAYTYAGSCASAIPISGTDWTNVINGVLSAAGAIGATVATGGMAAPMAVGTIASAAVNGSKPNVEKSGGMSGAAGLLSYQKPFIILTRPRQAMSKEQYKYMGYPSWASRDISALSGYIEVEYVHLDSINATDEELDEIHQLLTTGVIV